MAQEVAREPIARLRDGTGVGAWMFKAHPDVWDIGTALVEGVTLDWWRMASTYRALLVSPGHPCALWVTRGDPRIASGVWAIGVIAGEVHEDVGDPDDDLWRDTHAQRQLRPRVRVALSVLEEPLVKEQFASDPRLGNAEILRVPRIGNPAILTPPEWLALETLTSGRP